MDANESRNGVPAEVLASRSEDRSSDEALPCRPEAINQQKKSPGFPGPLLIGIDRIKTFYAPGLSEQRAVDC